MASFRSHLRHLVLERSLRVGQNIPLTEIAEATGISWSTLQKWHDPTYTFTRVDADTLYGLLEYFGCKFEDLLEKAPEGK